MESITLLQVTEVQGYGGEGGIRTPGTRQGTPAFKAGAINHSATSPDAFSTVYHVPLQLIFQN